MAHGLTNWLRQDWNFSHRKSFWMFIWNDDVIRSRDNCNLINFKPVSKPLSLLLSQFKLRDFCMNEPVGLWYFQCKIIKFIVSFVTSNLKESKCSALRLCFGESMKARLHVNETYRTLRNSTSGKILKLISWKRDYIYTRLLKNFEILLQ